MTGTAGEDNKIAIYPGNIFGKHFIYATDSPRNHDMICSRNS